MKLRGFIIGQAAVLAVLCGFGCKSDLTSNGKVIDLRMIDAVADGKFVLESYQVPQQISRAEGTVDSVDRPSGGGGDLEQPPSDVIEVASGWSFVSATRDVEWQADDLDGFEFAVSGLTDFGQNIRVYWAGPGMSFSEDRGATPLQKGDDLWQAILATHPGWTGQITRVRVDLPGPAVGSTVLHSFEPIVIGYDWERVLAAAGRYWQVDLGDDSRMAALVPAGRNFVWNLARPSDGTLRFSFGALGVAREELRLVVEVLGGSGDWVEVLVVPDNTPNSTTDPASRVSGWLDTRVELGRYGSVTAVKFNVESLSASQRFEGIGAVANPVIIRDSAGQPSVNVLLISLDTLRADRLRPYGYDKTTSPKLDARAARMGVTFTRTVAASPRTLPSHTTMLTGLDCLSHGVNHHLPAPRSLITLPEILRDHGYATLATVGGGLMNPAFGLDQGFDEYYSYSGWAGGFSELETEMEIAFDQLSRHSDRPFLIFFHTYEIHDPYHARPPFTDHCYAKFGLDSTNEIVFGALPRARSEEEKFLLFFDLMKWRRLDPVTTAVPVECDEIDLVSCLYDSSITFADSQVELLLENLESRGLLENTLVVITSDHGESLGEKGLFKHAYLSENNLMVPLIFFLPGGQYGGTVIDRQVATVDIVPTILDLLGIVLTNRLDGVSLLPLMEDDGAESAHRSEAWSYAAFENRGISLRIDDRLKYTFNNTLPSAAHGEEEIFMLNDDPGEHSNLASEDPQSLERLRHRLATYYEARTMGSPLVIENIGCDVVEGTLSAPSLTTRAKALDIDGTCIRRASDSQVEITIGAQQRLRLWIEATDVVDLELSARGCGLFERSSTLRRPIFVGGSEPVRIGLSDGEWRDAVNKEQYGGETGLSVLVSANGVGSSSYPVEDYEVTNQLRSLGYIE